MLGMLCRKQDEAIAIKIIKNIQKYRDAAKLEIKVLQKLNKKDPTNKNYCNELLRAFNYHGHICLLFPKLGKSVFDFTKENMYQPFPIEDEVYCPTVINISQISTLD